MRFADIPGLEEEKETLIRSVKQGHVAHAQMFLGKAGSANLAMALAFSAYIHCLNPSDNDACGECANCSKISKGVHPDVHYVFPVANIEKREPVSASFITEWRQFIQENPFGDVLHWREHAGLADKALNIARAESHKITANLGLKSFEGGFKIMIIWLPEYMHSVTANALLKILEEPPGQTLFFLVCIDIESVIGTIVSRCQVIHIPAFDDEQVSQYLRQHYEVSTEKAMEVAIMADGSLSEADHILSGGDNAYSDFFRRWLRHCYETDLISLHQDTETFASFSKTTQRNLLGFGLGIFRGSLLHRYQPGATLPSLNDEMKTFMTNFAKVLSVDKAAKFQELFSNAHYHLERNANVRLVFLNLGLQIAKTIRN
jgi:DNA polymerase-3 subunit delta'